MPKDATPNTKTTPTLSVGKPALKAEPMAPAAPTLRVPDTGTDGKATKARKGKKAAVKAPSAPKATASAKRPKAPKSKTPRAKGAPIAALDIGSSKIACFIAQPNEEGDLQVLGVGHHRSRGIRAGQICNLEEVENAVLAAVDAAERMAETRLESVVLNVSAGQPISTTVGVEMAIGGKEIRETQVSRLLDYGRTHQIAKDRELIHCIPLGYKVDGHDGTLDPRGMFGEELGVTIHLVTALSNPLRNVETVLGRCHIDIDDRVVSGYAAGLACLVDDEKDMGVTVIDMGGGTTSVAVFMEGHVIHTEVLPIGGSHVTTDIARVLGTPMAGAERLKIVHGGAIASPADEREILRVPLVGEEDEACANEVSRKTLIEIIAPRIEETFEMVRDRLAAANLDKVGGRVLVLTGGASQLDGARDLAERILDRQVRLGRPMRLNGLPESMAGPSFSVCAGLLRYALRHQVETPEPDAMSDRPVPPTGTMARVFTWLKENF